MRWRAQFSRRLPRRLSRKRSVRPEEAGRGAVPACMASCASGAEPLSGSDLGDDAGGVQGTASGDLEQPRGVGADERRELAVVGRDAVVELIDAFEQLCHDRRDGRDGAVLNEVLQLSNVAAVGELAWGRSHVGRVVVQVPTQAVAFPGALGDQSVVAVDQQRDLIALTGVSRMIQIRLTQRGAGHGGRINGIGLAVATAGAAGLAHQLGGHPHDRLTLREKGTFESSADLPAVLDRPPPLGVLLGPSHQLAVALVACRQGDVLK
jgi:hypothetical protein